MVQYHQETLVENHVLHEIEIREYHIRVPPFDLKVIHALNAQKNHVTENPLTLIQNNMT